MSVARTETVRGGGHGSAARAVAAGAPAGVVGGLAFGAAMAQLGVLPTVATLVGLGSSRAGFAVHMAISAVVGAGFGLMVRRQRCGPSETVFLGAAYGALWWCIGPLTLLPLALGQAPAWDVAAAQREFPGLLGHLVFGMGTALVFVVLHGPGDPGRVRRPVGVGTLVRGLLAGLLAALALRAVLHGRAPAVVPAIAVGLAQAALSPRSDQGIGAALVRGQGYGFVAWVVGELTVLPLLADAGLRWSLPEARASFPDLPGWLLLGALAAAIGTVLGRLAPLLSSEHLRAYSGAAAGSGVLAAALRGAVAGLLGGAVISQLMLRGAVPEVAERLTGSNGPLAGIAVNLAIGVPSACPTGCCSAGSARTSPARSAGACPTGSCGGSWARSPCCRPCSGATPSGARPRPAGPCPPWPATWSTAAASGSSSTCWRRRSGCHGWPGPGPRRYAPCAAVRSCWPPPPPSRRCCWPCS